MNRLEGKTAVITGGGSGLGFAAAQRFIEEGAFVFIFGQRQEVLDAAVKELGPNARAVQGSVTMHAELDRLFDTVKSVRGRLDVLLANAGVSEFVPLQHVTSEHYNRIFDVNVKGLLFTVQKALPLMDAGSSIILTGSSVGKTGSPNMSVYGATKAAVRNFARSWSQELRGTGIRVNVLSPGPMRTEAVLSLLDEATLDMISAQVPLGRAGEPADAAAVAAFLASADSCFMTGSEVFVDGGLAQI
ncbi:SDR family oxidoreductase [Rhizobium leguminosarum bv. viciae]|uniref:SDR family NAD(P)-dependent oxidoreductase n=1 Tax=Rhizobium leguminosarum TaxID=384 RepID=UPI001441CB00|nr:SDR family oxidoreductase [Rhizobium leguminosarum]NKJ94716.1 SDR family oxidoreductase [Rhizobium leguminosarum bv. viciae]NKK87470.1 SDR family oxidoreductase [Rhizobium leguminosarum bv. viciae]